MTDTIKLRQATDMPSEFEDWRELKEYLIAKKTDDKDNAVILIEVSDEDITDEIRKSVEKVRKMNPKDFINHRW